MSALHRLALTLALGVSLGAGLASGAEPVSTPNDGTILPFPPTPSASVAGPTLQESKHQRRVEPNRLPADAPNILIVLLDDAGFGSNSAFGGPCNTPTFEKLAAGGLRYTRFHSTALCAPTRAALLTGRNHHSVGMGTVTEIATAAPGCSTLKPNNKAPFPETLKLNGYSTAQFGKCHEVPVFQNSPVGPFDMWPTGSGFEYFYGFVAGEDNQISAKRGDEATQQVLCRNLDVLLQRGSELIGERSFSNDCFGRVVGYGDEGHYQQDPYRGHC